MRRIATALCAGVLAVMLAPASAGAAFGPAGSFGNGQLSQPQSVATDGSSIYVADATSGQVKVFNSAGVLQSPLTAAGILPQDVAIAPSGVVYAASPSRVDGWLLGVHIAHWSTPGVSYGIAVDPSGFIYVSDSQNGVIRKYDGLGNLQNTIGAGQLVQPQGLATDDSGSIYTADPGAGRILKLDSSGAAQQQWTMPTYTVVANGSTFTGRVEPHDVVVDGGGRVFAPDAGAHSNLVAVFPPNSDTWQQVFGSPDSDPGSPCPLRAPRGLATSPSGTLYVASTGENLIRSFDEASAACPLPNFGSGGGLQPAGAPSSVRDLRKPRIKLSGFPKGKCTRRNFAFLIHASDDVLLSRLTLLVNHRRVSRQSINRPDWSVRVRIPARKISRQIPRGTSARVLITVQVKDASGKKASVSRAFGICGAG